MQWLGYFESKEIRIMPFLMQHIHYHTTSILIYVKNQPGDSTKNNVGLLVNDITGIRTDYE